MTTNKPTGEPAGLRRRYYVRYALFSPQTGVTMPVYLADDADALLAARDVALSDAHRLLDDAKQIIAEKDAEIAALRPLANIGQLAYRRWFEGYDGSTTNEMLHDAIERHADYIAAHPTTATEEE